MNAATWEPKLARWSVGLATGSYANRTHISGESDVDVAVIYQTIFTNNWHFADADGPRRQAGPSAGVQSLPSPVGSGPLSLHTTRQRA